jgi:hypothetical protein
MNRTTAPPEPESTLSDETRSNRFRNDHDGHACHRAPPECENKKVTFHPFPG